MINELDKNTAILIITPHQIQPALSFLVFNNAFQDKVFARVHRLVGRLQQKLLGLLFGFILISFYFIFTKKLLQLLLVLIKILF